MIRVANILEEGKLGGPQIRVARIAKELSTKVDTTVICPQENSENFIQLLSKEKIAFKLFNLSRITKEPKVAIRYILFSAFEIYHLVRYFKKESFDIIHVSGGAWQYKGVIAGKIAGTHVLWHLNDSHLPKLFRKIFSLLSNIPDFYVFASTRTMNYYNSLIRHNKGGQIVRQPVNTSDFTADLNSPDVVSLKNQWSGKKIIGTVANINPIKDIELFIKVAALINSQRNDVEFLIVGPIHNNQKPYFSKLKKIMDELNVSNITFLGAQKDVRVFLNIFDVFLCTSVAESGPMTLWEAMSMGKAVVTTDVGDVGDVICKGVSGDIVQVADEIGMSDKVLQLLHDDKKRINYGIAAREVVLKNFETSVCAEQQYKAYKKTLSSKR